MRHSVLGGKIGRDGFSDRYFQEELILRPILVSSHI